MTLSIVLWCPYVLPYYQSSINLAEISFHRPTLALGMTEYIKKMQAYTSICFLHIQKKMYFKVIVRCNSEHLFLLVQFSPWRLFIFVHYYLHKLTGLPSHKLFQPHGLSPHVIISSASRTCCSYKGLFPGPQVDGFSA